MMASAKSNPIEKDTVLVGIGAAPGIGIGEAFLLNRARVVVAERPIDGEEVEEEIAQFVKALERSKEQLIAVKQAVSERAIADHLYIIDTHLLILEDEMLIQETERVIREDLISADGAIKKTLEKFRAVFSSIDDEYLRERRSDIDFVGDRILRNLTGRQQQPLSDIGKQAAIVAHDLSPSDTMQIDKEKIIGFVTDVGGRTSHTAIVARSLGIPAVVGLENVTALVPDCLPVIIDGTHGTVILNPSAETFKEYLKKKQSYEYAERELLTYCRLSSETTDGFPVTLRGNVELPEEVPMALSHGAEGIGLYRSEFLYMNRSTPPSEEEQYLAYRSILESMAPHPVTIRTLDVGGDKFVPQIHLDDEANPALGLRAVRFSLKEGHLFKIQLRAVLRASAHGRVRLMFPMISGVGEIRACKDYLEEARRELVEEGVEFDPGLEIGIMIETPSAVLVSDLLAKEVDFFSVGTNDLVQYCLAVDRSNEHVAYLYEPLHPSVLRALRMICDAARAEGIPVSMCGEMAGEPIYLPVLLGLGFDELSMNALGVPRVKCILRQISRKESQELLEELLTMDLASAIARRLEEVMSEKFPKILGNGGI